ncbi:MAG: D-glycero-beta-D-manno-heptose-7-phosphate kinase [Alphaproteobacteria bacterium]|nr:D-glycero-beta-D-manno-heptose-7-phosphate kinase [Alphaproteobacteria bacterium]MDP6516514.1 D-glycero-beta-D-manno-heptose-7-phosphate kinase [Alphaproteobacteria bacterium]
MSDIAGFTDTVDRLSRTSVLCIGDLMLDRFVHGAVDRISPEAPIPVLRVSRETAMLGGAGNVARNLVALGAKCTFVSVIGADEAGAQLGDLVAAEGGLDARLLTEPDRPSTIKTRYVAGGQQLLRADREMAAPLSEPTRKDLADAAAEALAGADVVVMSDYAKGVLAGPVAGAVIEAALAAGKPVVVDPKGSDFERYRGAQVVTPNRGELAVATGLAAGSDDEIVAAARELIADHGIEAVLVTRGRDGMSLITHQTAAHVGARARDVFDVSGAGDTVVAAFAAGIGAGLSREESMHIANTAAGIVVGKVGTAAVTTTDLAGALHRSEVLDADAKVVGLDGAVERVAVWRRRGARIGFTNGCFDLLHPGHLSLLGQARGHCDRLVVGLNSDASASRLKGEGRPVQSESARALVLASLAAVDLVVVFGDDTPLRMIERLRPDVLVKGADYRLGDVVGAPLVQSYGGEIVLAGLEPGHSTTGTIARLAR